MHQPISRQASTGQDSISPRPPKVGTGWRDRLPVHPAAELFPLMSKDELRELADDIKKNGLQERVKYVYDEEKQIHYLLDGRNRLDALELLGRDLFPGKEDNPGDRDYPEWFAGDCEIFDQEYCDDPVAYVISANIRRRHLKSEQKRDLVAKLLKLDPEKSNRQLAAMTGRDDKTIASVRADLERTAEIPQLKTTKGKDGKKRPTRRKKTKHEPQGTSVASSAEVPATSVLPVSETSPEDSVEQRKRVNAALEAVPDNASKADKESARWLEEFKYACETCLRKMNAVHRQAAVAYAAAYAAKIDKAAP